MKKLIASLFFFLALFSRSQAQEDICTLRISLLTCAPGEELYSTFGHTAMRVSDPFTGSDLVYNYGTFEFGPDFYTQFIRGKLLYFLSVENFNDFLYQYQMQSRSIVEQVLQLSCDEKRSLLASLNKNAEEQNRYYRYDFLFDNCTTRARDITKKNSAGVFLFKNILPPNPPTFRNLIHSYLDAGHQPWSKLGIDILLGVKLDKQVSNEQAMFLPDYLLKGFDSATVANRPLVASKQTILDLPSPLAGGGSLSPLFVFSALFLIIAALSFIKSRWAEKVLSVFDFIFFLLLGLTGILLLFMWFGTDHIVCRNNFNLLWALPTHMAAAFFVARGKRSGRNYFTVVLWLSVILAAAWFFLPQQMNIALFPLVLLVIIRSWQRSKYIQHAGTGDQS